MEGTGRPKEKEEGKERKKQEAFKYFTWLILLAQCMKLGKKHKGTLFPNLFPIGVLSLCRISYCCASIPLRPELFFTCKFCI